MDDITNKHFRGELELALHQYKGKLTFEYEMALDVSFVVNDKPYIVKTRKIKTQCYDDILDFDKIIEECNLEWKDKHVYIYDMVLTPPIIDSDSNRPETGKIIKIDWYDPNTLEPQTKLIDSSKLYRQILIRSCMRPIREQVNINHPDFLHNHPKMEGEHHINDNHVIVDIEDWKIIKEALNINRI